MPLDPQATAFIDKTRASGVHQMGNLTIEDMRAAVEQVIPLGYDFEDVNEVRDIEVPAGSARLPARVYSTPSDASRPTTLWLHGGSFTRCGIASHDTMWRRFVNRTHSIVVGLEF